jgi:hypothetical protein
MLLHLVGLESIVKPKKNQPYSSSLPYVFEFALLNFIPFLSFNSSDLLVLLCMKGWS